MNDTTTTTPRNGKANAAKTGFLTPEDLAGAAWMRKRQRDNVKRLTGVDWDDPKERMGALKILSTMSGPIMMASGPPELDEDNLISQWQDLHFAKKDKGYNRAAFNTFILEKFVPGFGGRGNLAAAEVDKELGIVFQRDGLTADSVRGVLRRLGGLPPELKAVDSNAATPLSELSHFDRKNSRALKGALTQLRIEIRYNLRRAQAEYREFGGEWHEFNDRAMGNLRDTIAECFTYQTSRDGARSLHYGRETWEVCLNALLYHREVDPFLEWLESLPPWDGANRLDRWLRDVFTLANTNDPGLVEWVSKFVFLGAVWRAYEPGTKLDEMPVLCGKQGIGKSTSLRLTLPAHLPDLFADGLHLAAPSKDRAEALQGRVIVEVPEMAGITRAELESMKAFLSRVDDGTVRLAYRRNPESSPRRAIIVGTTNDPEPLPNDPSGNRRFVVVRITDGDAGEIAQYLEANREQLWTEAVQRYKNRETAWLPSSLKQAQTDMNDTARQRDEILEDKVDYWLATQAPETGFTMADVVEGIGLKSKYQTTGGTTQADQRRIAAILRRKGYQNYRERQTRKWRKQL